MLFARLGLAVQPAVIQGLVEKRGFRGRGLLGRILYSLPYSLLGHRDTNPPPVPDHVRIAYNDHVLALLRLPLTAGESDGISHHELHLHPDALAAIQGFEGWLEPQLAEFGKLGNIADWAGKLVGAIGRIAGNLHMAQHAESSAPWDMCIGRETVEAAIQIGRYLIPHAQAAFALMGADVAIEQAKLIQRFIDHQHLEDFSKRELHQGVKGTFKRVDELDQPLAVLVNHGFIRQRLEPERAGPGRKPSPLYDVNPIWIQCGRDTRALVHSENSENCEKGVAHEGSSLPKVRGKRLTLANTGLA